MRGGWEANYQKRIGTARGSDIEDPEKKQEQHFRQKSQPRKSRIGLKLWKNWGFSRQQIRWGKKKGRSSGKKKKRKKVDPPYSTGAYKGVEKGTWKILKFGELRSITLTGFGDN